MKKTISLILIILIASVAGTIGKELFKDVGRDTSSEQLIKKCVENMNKSADECKEMISQSEEIMRKELEKVGDQTQEERDETIKVAERKAFIAGCSQQPNMNEGFCGCAFDKIIEKYGYEEYDRIEKDVIDSGLEGTERAKGFANFFKNEVPLMCMEN